MKLYLAGPMTNYEHYNFPAFDAAAAQLRAAGHEVFSPAENDRENGFDATGLQGHEAAEHGFDLRTALKQDLSRICDHAEGIALLEGWEESKGARAEVALAKALGIPAEREWRWRTPAYGSGMLPNLLFAKGGLASSGHWKAGDTAYGIRLDNGYVYINQAAVDQYGLDMLAKINGSGVQKVTVAE